LRIVKLLLDHDADPNIVLPAKKGNPGGWKLRSRSPLSLAILREESLQLIKVLPKAGADATQCGLALFDAVKLEKAAEFRLLVDLTLISMCISRAGPLLNVCSRAIARVFEKPVLALMIRLLHGSWLVTQLIAMVVAGAETTSFRMTIYICSTNN
jgi:hypothetical protein